MPLDPALSAEIKGWLGKASKDLGAASYELVADPPFLEDIVFHAQQAVEKSLKAFMTWHGKPFRKTHNLVELGQACTELDPTLRDLLRQAAPLSEYAWKFRYPGDPQEPSLEEATEALDLAHRVYVAVTDRLPPDARP